MTPFIPQFLIVLFSTALFYVMCWLVDDLPPLWGLLAVLIILTTIVGAVGTMTR